MSSLLVGGVAIKVAVSSPRWTRSDGVDRSRSLDGTLRASQTGGAVRVWDFETPPVLASTEGETYKAALSMVASQLCSGDIIALPTMCSAELTDGVPTSVAGEPYVVLSFSLHEVQPAKVLLRYAPGDTITGESFSRSTTGKYHDNSGLVVTAAINGKRDGHYIQNVRTLLLEEASTNVLLRSEEFDNAAWAKTNITVTANNTVAPDGTATGDKVAATAAAATVFTQDAVVAATSATYSIYVKKGSGATDANRFWLYNVTTAANLLAIDFNYDTGGISYVIGSSGARLDVANLGGWFRLVLSVSSGITSGDTIRVYPGFAGDVQTAGEYAYFWGAQLEGKPFPTSYIPTTTVAATKTASAYSLPFAEPPKEMSVYAKFVEGGSITTAGAPIFAVTSAGGAAPFLLCYAPAGFYAANHNNGAGGSVFSVLAASPVLGNTVELLASLFGDGSVQITQSINGAAAVSATQTAAVAFGAAWGGQLVFLNAGVTGVTGFTALQSFKIISGSRSLAEMRAL